MTGEVDRNGEQVATVEVNAVQVVLVREKDSQTEVLLGHRSSEGFAHQWSFLGGKIDEGESPEQAARRELREEAGVDILEDDFVFYRDTESETMRKKDGKTKKYRYKIKVFTVNGQDLSPHNSSPGEHSEIRWFTFEDALSMHHRAVALQQTTGVYRSTDKIPGALSPRTFETMEMLAKRQK